MSWYQEKPKTSLNLISETNPDKDGNEKSFEEVHITPLGASQIFIYRVFKAKGG